MDASLTERRFALLKIHKPDGRFDLLESRAISFKVARLIIKSLAAISLSDLVCHGINKKEHLSTSLSPVVCLAARSHATG